MEELLKTQIIQRKASKLYTGNYPTIFIITILIITIIICKTSQDEILPFLNFYPFDIFFTQFSTGNNVINTLSTGVIITFIFHYFIVHIPVRAKILRSEIEIIATIYFILIEISNIDAVKFEHFISQKESDKYSDSYLEELQNEIYINTIFNKQRYIESMLEESLESIKQPINTLINDDFNKYRNLSIIPTTINKMLLSFRMLSKSDEIPIYTPHFTVLLISTLRGI